MRFTGIPAERLDEFWDRVKERLETVINRSSGDHTLESVYQDIAKEDFQLWGFFTDDLSDCRMVTVTQLTKFSTGRIWCELVFCSGEDMEEWLPCLSMIEVWAQTNGCDGMRLIGRKGWAKVLPGYREAAVLLRKEF